MNNGSEQILHQIQSILSEEPSLNLTETAINFLNGMPSDLIVLLRSMFESARDPYTSWQAFQAMMCINSFDKVQFLVASLKNSSAEWRKIYCKALAQFDDQRAIHQLCELYISDHDIELRYVIADLLVIIGNESVINLIFNEQFTDDRFDEFPIALITKQVIQKILEKPTNYVFPRKYSKSSSSTSGQDAEELVQQWANETEVVAKHRQFETILSKGEFDIVRWLSNLLDKSTFGWRSAYVKELSNYTDQRALNLLTNLLFNEKDAHLRYVTAQSLANNGDASVLSVLDHVAKHDIGTDYEGRPIAEVATHTSEMIRQRLYN